MSFSENLKNIREKKRVSQYELAEAIDVNQAAICRFEKGKINPRPETIGDIADALGVTCDELIKGQATAK